MDPNIMHLQILKIKDSGDLENERVILRATKQCDIRWYMLFDNTYDAQGNLSNLWRHMYLFPPLQLNEGDFIWLYTKAGENTSRGNTSNTTTHLLHWGFEETIWNRDDDVAYLVKYVDSQAVKK